MTSPEISYTVANGYIELPVDVDPNQLIADQLDAIGVAVPGFVYREGHLEVNLIEAFAQMAAETAQVAAMVPIAIFLYFGQLVGVLPEPGASAQTMSTWTAIDDQGYTIAAGAQVGFAVTGSELMLFQTTADAVIPPGETSVDNVPIVALAVGTAYNGIESSPLVVVDGLRFIESAESNGTTVGGVDAESQADYLDRLSSELQFLAPRPILPGDFAGLAPQTQGVFRATAIDGLSPGRVLSGCVLTDGETLLSCSTADFVADDAGRSLSGAGVAAGAHIAGAPSSGTTATMSAPATATEAADTITLGDLTGQERCVAVAGVDANGAALSDDVKAALQADLEAKREVNFLVSVIDPTYTEIDVTVQAQALPGQDTDAVTAAIQAALSAFLSPATWGGGDQQPPTWDPTATVVRFLDVAAVVKSVAGVAYINSLAIGVHGGSTGSGDVDLPGDAPLPSVGTLAVTTV